MVESNVPLTERENRQTSKKSNRKTFNAAKIRRSDKMLIDEDKVSIDYAGKMNNVCEHCGALYFANEESTNKTYNKCCHNGTIQIDTDEDYPQFIINLMNENNEDAKNFRRNIREYNNKLAFGTFIAALDILPTSGPLVYRIHGQTYRTVPAALYANDPKNSKYAQLYVLDNEIANNIRKETNEKLNLKILKKLDQYIREVNPYAEAYKFEHEIEEKQKKHTGNGISNVRLCLTREPASKTGSAAIKACNEIAIIYVATDDTPDFKRDIAMEPRATNGNQSTTIPVISKHADPLVYPLLFPNGKPGWCPYMKSKIHGKTISTLKYYAYHFQNRGYFNPYINSKRLTQQFVVDAFTKIECSRLYYIRKEQKKFRTEEYQGLTDYVRNKAYEDGIGVGKMTILPSSFYDGPRARQQSFQDSICLVREFGKPDIFLTITRNPHWPEIKEQLRPTEDAFDRPDIVTRVFKRKLSVLIDLLKKQHVLGELRADLHTIEFQKRGLPHAHMLLYLKDPNSIKTLEKINELISAEIPDITVNPKLYNLVKTHMIHGPCGVQNPKSPCMVQNNCTKNFPKAFREETEFNQDVGYPLYKRPNNGRKIIYGAGQQKRQADNRYVVPYNPYLLLKMNCHINVEICCTIKCVKYLYKYIFKGPDMATVKITVSSGDQTSENVQYDEVTQFLSTRYLCPPEAMWRIWEYKMHDMSHTVNRLAVHLENRQQICFEQGKEQKALDINWKTTLTAWFELNKRDVTAQQYLYTEIPNHYTWQPKDKTWKPRQRNRKPLLTRMYFVSPKQQERYYLRLLLLHVRGAQSFTDLRTYCGTLYNTYKEAAVARDLVIRDDEWEKCLIEAARFKFPREMCNLFAYLLIFHQPANAHELYQKYREHFLDTSKPEDIAEATCLKTINDILLMHNMNLEEFGLPKFDANDVAKTATRLLRPSDLDNLVKSLNKNQKTAYDAIMTAATKENSNKLIFIDGPGGSGKSYLHNILIDVLNYRHIKVLPIAWTGIAANLLTDGQTVHTAFKLPLNLNERTTCDKSVNSAYAKLLQEIKVIIWDEISMANVHAFHAIDTLLRELCQTEEFFGGKTVVLSGDFRQILPVVPRRTKADVLKLCVKSSPHWANFKQYQLHENMRVQRNTDSEDFKKWLLNIGEGKSKNKFESENDLISLPHDITVKTDIINAIYGNKITTDDTSVHQKAILAPRNIDVLAINDKVLDILEGTLHHCLSVDTLRNTQTDQNGEYIPQEYINSLTPNGMPPHDLKLKIRAIVILLRNMNIKEGLCNGTRLKIIEIKSFLIFAEIISGRCAGNKVFIPRIELEPSKDEIPFSFTRRQLPIRVAYAVTINKGQGQSYDSVGIYLTVPVFSHGQMYVAASRAKNKNLLKIQLSEDATYCNGITKSNTKGGKSTEDITYTTNIVYKEILH